MCWYYINRYGTVITNYCCTEEVNGVVVHHFVGWTIIVVIHNALTTANSELICEIAPMCGTVAEAVYISDNRKALTYNVHNEFSLYLLYLSGQQ